MNAVREYLLKLRGKRVVFILVGNELRGDDGLGPLIYRILNLKDETVINAGMAPENFIHRICDMSPQVVVFVDSIDAGLEPGSIIIGDLLELEKKLSILTTHSLPLSLIANFIESFVQKKVEFVLIGVQARTLDIGAEMSLEVVDAAKIIAKAISDFIASNKNCF